MSEDPRLADPRLSIVIPTKEGASNLEAILPDLPPAREGILVDGRSVDGTVEAPRSLLPDVRVVNQTRKGKAGR